MKYITKEMWPGSFGINETDRAWLLLDDLWESRLALRREDLSCVSHRLHVRTYKKFLESDFHNFSLRKLELRQEGIGTKRHAELILKIDNYEESYEIQFSSILRLEIGEVETSMDDKAEELWGYSEIMAVDDKSMSFEVIFSSGKNLFVVFPNKKLRIKKV